MTKRFYVKSISGFAPDDGWCIQCENCGQTVHESDSSGDLCLDCLCLHAKQLIDENDFSEFEDIEVNDFFEEVDHDCWEVDFVFYYKGKRFYCNGMAGGCESAGYSPESMYSDTLKINE